MDFSQYLMAVAVVFIGIFAGILISNFTREELPTGKRYFLIAQKVLLILMLVALFYFIKPNALAYFFIILFILANALYNKTWVNYASFGVLLPFSMVRTELFIIISCLMLLYGFLTGSVFQAQLKGRKEVLKAALLRHLLFLPIAILFYFVF